MLLAALLAGLVGGASSAEASIPREEPQVLLEQPVPLLEQSPLLEVPADEPAVAVSAAGGSLPLFAPGRGPDGLFDGVRIPALERFQAETRYRVIELEIEIRAELERLQAPERNGFALFGGGEPRRGSPNRYYGPELGRFISADPLGYVDGPSMYGFAGDSPLNYTDPLGLESKAEWQAIVNREIETKHGLDMDLWLPELGFLHNARIVEGVYDWYAQIFLANSAMAWTGMAKMAGGTVYAALNQTTLISVYADVWRLPSDRSGVSKSIGETVATTARRIEVELLRMNKRIFEDLAWQHRAYLEKGLSELEERAEMNEITPENLRAWRLIDLGVSSNSSSLVLAGNKMLLRREQQIILEEGYKRITQMWGGVVTLVMSQLAENPIPGGLSFSEFYAAQSWRNIVRFEDRWLWIDATMWHRWNSLPVSEQKRLVRLPLKQLAERDFH